jgi:hypothetical protein
MHIRSAILAAALAIGASHAHADIALIGRASIPGSARDKSGLADSVSAPGSTTKVPHDLLGGFGSAIDSLGRDNLYVACDDRGPGDGTIPWRCRFQTFRILIAPGEPEPVKVELVSTTLLTDESGHPLDGVSTGFNAERPLLAPRFDAEGIRLTHAGTLLISDEYGPWIDEFSLAGRRLRRLPIPAKFQIDHPSADPKAELASNSKGRDPNHGFEGLALSLDGKLATAILQYPLIQDAVRADKGKLKGVNLRMLQIVLASGESRELVYRLESPKHCVNELLAVDDHRFLAIERDGLEARSRGLFLVDSSRATDVSSIDPLPAALPDSIVPVSKTRWLDFMDPRWSLAGGSAAAKMPEKIEGLAFGPDLPDGRRTLIVTTDNDLRADEPSWFWVFAFAPGDLSPGAAPPSRPIPDHAP